MTRRAVGISCVLALLAKLPTGTAAQAATCITNPPNSCTGVASFLNGSYGNDNDAFGLGTLQSNTTGLWNSAYGDGAMAQNTSGSQNVAMGVNALLLNDGGNDNVAVGVYTLLQNTADGNTAIGYEALYGSTTGPYNSAVGFQALYGNTTGSYNTASGYQSLLNNTGGSYNVALGTISLNNNTTGFENTAVGPGALMWLQSGYANLGIGLLAGAAYTAGESYNIAIGNGGVAGDWGVTRIGSASSQFKAYIAGIYGATVASGIPLFVNSAGQLGTATSSLRFKEDVADMGAASDKLMELRPVTFHYKTQFDDGQHLLQYGLIAEEVAAVDPGLVQFGDDGKPLTVRYQFVNAMLLGEVQKQRSAVTRQATAIAALERTIASQRSALAALTERLAKLEAAAGVH